MITTNRTMVQVLLALGIGAVIGGCVGGLVIAAFATYPVVVGAPVPTEMSPLTPTPRVLATITLAPTFTRTPSPPAALLTTPTPTTLDVTTRTPMVLRATPKPIAPHFWLARPVPLNAPTPHPALTYLYGTTARGDYDVHHGVEFVNPTGTPVLAVGDGVIVTAGNDTQQRLCGDDGKRVCGRDVNFYGNLIVLQLDRHYNGQRMFALYGHLSKINVNVGDRVKTGDVLGAIGMTGIALGPHLHFEVRVGVNDYAHTRNPILWLAPLNGRGALAGRLSDGKGNVQRSVIINLYRAEPETFLYGIETYGRDDAPPVNADDEFGENFAFPDLVPGDYIVRVQNQPYAARITIAAGKLTFIEWGNQ